jgi:DNA modification methylase
MFILSKGKIKTFNPIKDRKNKWVGEKWSSGRTRRTVNGGLTVQEVYEGSENDTGVRFNVWLYDTGAGYTTKDKYAFEHPAMFPEALAQDHILSWSNPGDIVLDPFIGSGTTAKMAKQNGRHWIGIDISSEYCKLAEKRVTGANVPLFT